MVNVLLSPQAELDLEQIYEYTALSWGLLQADKYLDQLEEGMRQIAENMAIGKLYPHMEGDYRYYHINKHLIFYKREKEALVVIRFLHERMKVSDKL